MSPPPSGLLEGWQDASAVRPDVDGMMVAEARFPPGGADPLFRALMRAEAELLCEDADRMGSPGYEDRTPDQRRADALLRLGDALAAR